MLPVRPAPGLTDQQRETVRALFRRMNADPTYNRIDFSADLRTALGPDGYAALREQLRLRLPSAGARLQFNSLRASLQDANMTDADDNVDDNESFSAE